MSLSARRALNDMWMRVRTSMQLIGASARTARRQRELLVFPVLSLVATSALFLGLLVLSGPVVLLVQAHNVSPGMVVVAVVAVGLPFLYLIRASATFFNVALTFAAFRAFRDERTSPRTALAHALGRVGAIMAFSAAAIAAAVLAAPLDSLPRSRRFFGRLLPSFDVAWSVVPLIAIPVLVREPCGGLAAVRRAVTLFRERWAETTIAVVGVKLLCLPIAAASVFFFQHSLSNSSGRPGFVWVVVFLVLCATPILIDSFVSSIYGSALYVFAVEGVIPNAFDIAELTTVWRVGAVPAADSPQPSGPSGDVRAARGSWWAALAIVAAAIVLAVSGGRWAPHAMQPFRQLVSGLRPGLTVNDQNFPERLRMVWSRELSERIFGLTVRPDGQIVAGAYPTIFVLDRAGSVIQQFTNHPELAPRGYGSSLMVSANLPGTPGTSLIVSGRWSPAIGAYDSSGARRWSWQTTESGAAVDDIAAIRVPGRGDFVAIGRNGFGGLCVLDAGVEQWCNKSIGNVDFVTTIDCDGDGRDEILSLSPHSHPYFGSKLGCYSTQGKLVRDLNVPTVPYGLRTFDARGDGRKDLIAWYKDGLSGPLVLAAWTPEGQVLGELRLQTAMSATASITGVSLRPGKGSDIAVALPDGWVVGTSLEGERWGHHIAGADGIGLALAALDLEGDGAQELIIASGKTVSAWTWNGRAPREPGHRDASPSRQ